MPTMRAKELTDSTSYQFKTWTTTELARAAEVSKRTVQRAIQRLIGHLDPPRYRRDGSHPRKHRVYTEREASLILETLLQVPIDAC